MKRMTTVWLAGLVAVVLGSAAFAQNSGNLADYARQARKQKAQAAPAAKTFDNDNLPREDKLSVVGQPPAETAVDANQQASGEPAPAGDGEKAATPAQGTAESGASKEAQNDEQAAKQKMYQDWQKKIHDQKDKIDLLTRELDVANREYRLRAASFYADAGNRLRNSAAWDKEDAQYKHQIANKQKALDESKLGLEDMQEQARKAGVPSSMRD